MKGASGLGRQTQPDGRGKMAEADQVLEADSKGQQGGNRQTTQCKHVGVRALQRRHVQGTLSVACQILVPGTERRSGQGRPVAGGRNLTWASRQWWQHLRRVAEEMLRRRGFGPTGGRLLRGVVPGLCLCLRLANLREREAIGIGIVGGSCSRIRPRVATVFRATLQLQGSVFQGQSV